MIICHCQRISDRDIHAAIVERRLPPGAHLPEAHLAKVFGVSRTLVRQALQSRRVGPYSLQAAIAAVHAEAVDAAHTDWGQIVGLYDVLLRVEPSPVVELNRAVAVAMRDGAEAGLALVEALLAAGHLDGYHLAHAARADLCRRLGRLEDARASYERALALAKLEPERRFLEGRLREVGG